MKTMNIKITFTEEVLGTAASDPKVHETFIASKAPDAKSREEEVADLGVDGVVDKTKTIFPKKDGHPFIYDYQLKGFFKDAQKGLNRWSVYEDPKSGEKINLKLSAYKEKIDHCIFIYPRRVFFHLSDNKIGDCQRPLRAETAQGPRVALANSESLSAGSWIKFKISILENDLQKYVVYCLDNGVQFGIGQWRNSGKGKFLWELFDDEGKVIGGNKKKWDKILDERKREEEEELASLAEIVPDDETKGGD